MPNDPQTDGTDARDVQTDGTDARDVQTDGTDARNVQTDGTDAREPQSEAYVGAYDKLVRDDIPAVVRADGNHPVTRQVDGREYERYLAGKLREEADELADAVTSEMTGVDGDEHAAIDRDEHTLDELADVHAVLDALVSTTDHSMQDVVSRAREKATDRGAFDDGVVLERIDADE
ncbi:nucleoside triphosphate pyrophosphohydrolase [Halorubellus salinus]|uniref:nucleoside triphosphate pyrophosphohydrolase n=1 Tax=Halorubellus salinus TaxID=755309 RepID=UPI001D07E0C0|nr:nucleoside triphosphate pyrophosphohydrolase [Halorubellus salinus]